MSLMCYIRHIYLRGRVCNKYKQKDIALRNWYSIKHIVSICIWVVHCNNIYLGYKKINNIIDGWTVVDIAYARTEPTFCEIGGHEKAKCSLNVKLQIDHDLKITEYNNWALCHMVICLCLTDTILNYPCDMRFIETGWIIVYFMEFM